MINGIINVYKEAGFTSFDVVAKLRGITRQKKIGHTGTLDPDATGVLPVCFGSATKLCDLLTDKTKEYEAVFKLGITTDTQDISGSILEEKEVNVTTSDIENIVPDFLGKQKQIPPMYSAIKIDGQRLYELARQGKEVERPARDIEILKLEILELNIPFVKIAVGCSKGTYIRTLIHDMGQKLGCGATMTELVRTRSGEFELKDAIKLSDIQKLADDGMLEEKVLCVDKVFEKYPAVINTGENLKRLVNGNKIHIANQGEYVRMYDDQNKFLGLYRYSAKDKGYIPEKMFL